MYKKEDLLVQEDRLHLLVQEEDLLLVEEEDLLLVQEEYLLLVQEEDLLLVQEELFFFYTNGLKKNRGFNSKKALFKGEVSFL